MAGRSELLNQKDGNTYFDDIQGTLTLGQMPLSSGEVRYVHSVTGDDGNAGTKDAPMATWDAAHDLADANDVILLKAGHAENIAAAAGVVLDTAGVITIGEGNGESRPTITFITDADADIDIEAAGVGIFGVRFICNIASQVAMLDIDESSAKIEGNEFLEGTQTGLTFIDVNGGTANDCDDTVICKNFFYAPTAGNMNAAIELGEIADSVLIEDNVIVGDFDDAGIHNPTGKILTNLMIRNNHVSQLLSANHAIELVSACTGFLNDNHLYADAFATTLDPGSLKCSGNLAVSAIDEGGTPIPALGDNTDNYIGTDSANNDAATTAVVVNRDGSLLERSEFVINEVIGAALNKDSVNYLAVSADLSSATWNTVAAHEILTVTGLNRIRIMVECTVTCDDTTGNTATIVLGDETTSDALIASTEVDDILDTELWYDATPTLSADAFASVILDYITNGLDIGYEIAVEAATAGTLVFHVWWEPLNATGAVVAGAGGPL